MFDLYSFLWVINVAVVPSNLSKDARNLLYSSLFFLYICSVFVLSHMLHSKGWIMQVVQQDAMGT